MPIFRKDDSTILFVHVPKTGGSSIERLFKLSGYTVSYLDGKVGPTTMNHLRSCTPQHMHAEMLNLLFRIERFDHVFIVVREPTSRLRSEYLWRTRRKQPVAVDGATVEKWAMTCFERFERNRFVYDNHFRPQSEFHLPGSEVFHFEDGLQDVMRTIDQNWDLGLQSDLPRVREGFVATGQSSDSVEITPFLSARIQDFYREDYVRFGYPAVPAVATP